ncbi:MAG: TatD family hydrolase [Endomicrobiia bacterium]
MFDTHTHLFDKKLLPEIKDILEKLKNYKFKGLVCICETQQEVDLFLKYYKSYDFLYSSLGVHPHNSKNFNKQTFIDMYEQLYSTGRLVAIGETGLDFYYNFSSKNEQINCLLTQIDFAKEKNLPLIIHCRNSDEEIYNILKEKNVSNGVLHCYSSDYDFAKKILDLGLYLGFTGIITFKKDNKISETIKYVPVEKILIETDAPYLSPEPFRGKINTPLNLYYILNKVSELKKINIKIIENILDKNATELFLKYNCQTNEKDK